MASRAHRSFRNTSICILIAAGTTAAAQSFAPFTANGRQLFASLDHHRTFSIAFDSTQVNGDTTSYFNFRTVSDTWVPSNCPWWGGPECRPMDVPTWAGQRIDAAADGGHRFHNVWNEPLHVPFQTDPQDTVVMYTDAAQKFLLVYETEFFMSNLGLVENTRQWRILHRDLLGNTIPSALNDYPIQVGETAGLLRFFRVDSFPQVLEPVELIGRTSPDLGFHSVTPALLHDHQPGDEIQFHETYYMQMGPPWNNYDRYRKYTFLTRQPVLDAVQYSVRQEVFNTGSLDLVVDTITLSYDQTTILATIPFERFDGTQPVLTEVALCGLPLWSYTTFPNQGVAYCEEEHCWGPYDTNGPPPNGQDQEVLGLGRFDHASYILSPNGYSQYDNIVYFKKNGVECLSEVVMGLEPAPPGEPAMTLAPNPSIGTVTLTSRSMMTGAEVLDVQGRVVASASIDGVQSTMDLQASPAGAYVVRVRFADGHSVSQRLLLIRD